MRSIEVAGGLIILHSDYADRRAIGLHLSAARWHGQSKTWRAPATPAIWRVVMALWPDCPWQGGSELGAMVTARELALYDARAVLTGAHAPDDYVYVTEPWLHQRAATRLLIRTDAALLHCHMGTGKALRDDALVFTPDGPHPITSLSLGDTVLTPDGETSAVLGIYPQGMQPVYRVHFSCGDYVHCTGDHLWTVHSWKQCGAGQRSQNVTITETKPLKDMRADHAYTTESGRTNHKYWVDLPGPLNYPARAVRVDPYLLGVLLGDGYLPKSGVHLTTADDEILAAVVRCSPPGAKWSPGSRYDYHLSGWIALRDELGFLGLLGKHSHDKFVPKSYRINSVEVRIAVLQGLMDTDGTVGSGGHVSYTSTSQTLAMHIKELVESLGGMATVKSRIPHYTHKGKRLQGRRAWRLSIRYPEPKDLFRLARKRARADRNIKYPPKRMITRIELMANAPCTCIRIADPRGLFLTDHAIPTHNTKMVLDALRARGAERVLIVCPNTVKAVWRDEIETHAPDMLPRLLVLDKGSVAKRERLVREHTGPVLVVVNYESAWRVPLGGTLAGERWDAVILDESHRAKSPGAKCSRWAAKLTAGLKACLTGTPLPHSPLDAYGQYRFLDVGLLGSRFAAFRDRYAVMGGYEGHQIFGWRNQEELRGRLDVLRLEITDSVLTLPDLQTVDRHVDLSPAALRVYQSLEQEFIAEVASGVVTVSNALSKLLRLQQITSGYLKADDADEPDVVDSAKTDALRELLEDAGEPVAVFARFKHDLAETRTICQTLGLRYGEISGRANDYGAWRKGEADVLGVQVQSGSMGLNLTRARLLVFYSLGYSLGDYQQAVARVHRPGQERPVVIYRLLARGTVDEKIIKGLDKRSGVIESLLHGFSLDTV